jgi:hypothetical protein
MVANLVKRRIADPWSLETTTMFTPGERSIAERTFEYAQLVAKGEQADPSLFYFHRQAGDDHDLETENGVRDAILEASGPAAAWSDVDGIVGLWRDPTTDRGYFERVWLNRPVQQTEQAFDVKLFTSLVREEPVPAGAAVVLGFDGSRFHDDTALVATELASGTQTVLGHWRHPGRNFEDWQVPEDEVHQVFEVAFERFKVKRLFADPFYWESAVAMWQARFGDRVVSPWATNRPKQMGEAIAAYVTAARTGELGHDGSPVLLEHLGNARRHEIHYRGDQGERLFTIRKERPDSPHKIDVVMAAVLSWAARIAELDQPAERAYGKASWR